MTDLEIDKALALAIGWKEADMILDHKAKRLCFDGPRLAGVFDYRDWNVIGPIAARYDCFPWQDYRGNWVTNLNLHTTAPQYLHTTTPQRAIALAVIGAKK